MWYRLACVLAVLVTGPAAAYGQLLGTVSGVVVDATGAPVAGVLVHLQALDHRGNRASTSDASGTFVLTDVRPGAYTAIFDAPGFAEFVTPPFTVSAASPAYVLPRTALALEPMAASVTVRPVEAIAAEQIRAQEKQRLLGIVPNFYVSYVPDAAPLTSRQKLSLAMRETFDWTAFVGATIASGTQQATRTHPGFGVGATGYAKRWAAAFADDRTGDLLDHYVFASVFRQDPRYFYQGSGTAAGRAVHAVTSAFVARRDGGGLMPNYAYMFGAVGAAVLSNTYYPRAARGTNLILTNVAAGVASRAAANLVQEFVGKRLTAHVPRAGDGASIPD